jgi:hypothetical protein
MGTKSKAVLLTSVAFFASAACLHAHAAVPSTVSIPGGGNYGSTSYYDGFGRVTPGFTLLQYGTYEDITAIKDAAGDDSPAFKDPHIQAFVSLTQVSYTTNWHPFGGDGVAFSVAVPLVDLNSSFASSSPVKLSNNNFAVGDTVFGPIYQSRYYFEGHRPVFAWRFQLIILAPTGGFNRNKNINQGSEYWAINPYISATWVPLPKLEFSTRFNYQYNLQTNQIPSPPPIPGLVYKNGQAGDYIYDNFDASYKLTHKFELGFNGFFIDQLGLNKTNGISVGKSRESEVYIGPGIHYAYNPSNLININLYLPVEAANASVGPKFNVQYIHRF